MKSIMPEIYRELHDTVKGLERHMKDMQDTEFTVQDGRLFMWVPLGLGLGLGLGVSGCT